MDGSEIPVVDLVVLTRSADPLRPEVEQALRAQQGVQVIVHRVLGEPRTSDRCRWETIARARNSGKLLGHSPWLMFLDDDVVLAPDCISTLLSELNERPIYAALAADYSDREHPAHIAGHVAMGATLFRRTALDQIQFRWTDDRCECQCCCDDLRRALWGIDYLPSARAVHLRPAPSTADQGDVPTSAESTDRDLPTEQVAATTPSVVLVVCYFGTPPGWIDYYLRSCAHNPTINFLVLSDCGDFPEVPPNVRLVRLSPSEFNRLASRKLGFEVSLTHAHKLCDFKPLYGHLFAEYLEGFDYWGYTDLDVIYGDLRRYLSAARISAYDVFTTRREFLVGHFTLFRNTPALCTLFEQSRDYRATLLAPEVRCFDECGNELWSRLGGPSCCSAASCDSMTHVVTRLMEAGQLNVCFAQRVLEWPELGMTNWRVRWQEGRLSLMHPAREYMYCHFHGFKYQLGYKLPPRLGVEQCFELTALGIEQPRPPRAAATERAPVALAARQIASLT